MIIETYMFIILSHSSVMSKIKMLWLGLFCLFIQNSITKALLHTFVKYQHFLNTSLHIFLEISALSWTFVACWHIIIWHTHFACSLIDILFSYYALVMLALSLIYSQTNNDLFWHTLSKCFFLFNPGWCSNYNMSLVPYV